MTTEQMTFVPHTFTEEDISKGIDPVEAIRNAVGEEQYAVALVEVIKPLAKKWLRHMEYNREISRMYVRKYRMSMENGKWFITNQGLGFNRRGRLIDGDNRLEAFINSQCKSIIMPIAVNISNEAQTMAIDQVNPRKLRHLISMREKRAVDQFEITIANYVWGFSPAALGRLTSVDLDRYMMECHQRRHKPAMNWTMSLYESLPLKRFKTKHEPAIFACAMRAYDYVTRDKKSSDSRKQNMVGKIERFVKVSLDRADPRPGLDGWASNMRKTLDEIRADKLQHGRRGTVTKSGPQLMRRQFYLTVNNTLYKHLKELECSSKSRVTVAKLEHFPFKEEEPGLDERIALRMKSSSF